MSEYVKLKALLTKHEWRKLKAIWPEKPDHKLFDLAEKLAVFAYCLLVPIYIDYRIDELNKTLTTEISELSTRVDALEMTISNQP